LSPHRFAIGLSFVQDSFSQITISMKQLSATHFIPLIRGRWALLSLLLVLWLSPACRKDHNSDYIYDYPAPHPTGVPPLSGMLPRENIVMKSVIHVDLNRHVARIPLFKGRFNGQRVWFVRLDVSEAQLANNLGLNFAPRLANADIGCPACVDDVTSADTIPGKAEVNFSGTVDFSPMRSVMPGPLGFPPASVTPGAVGTELYSDLIRVQGAKAVFNAPIIATGNGPFDVSQSHTNTHDRVVAIDTVSMTVDLQVVRAFAFGKDIFYFSIAATAPVAAAIEKGIFVPAMANIPSPNKVDDPATARADIFSFANGKRGLDDPNVQGLNHVILDNAPGEFSNDNPALYETLRHFGDARNVLGKFTTLDDVNERLLYSPIWDLHIAKWTDSVVQAGINFAQNDANTIRQLARRGYITNPDGTPLSSSGIIVNCPLIGFAVSPPRRNQAPE
jgi:hypothetical protein